MPHSLSAQWKEGTLPGKLTTNGSQLEGQMWSSELSGLKTTLGQAGGNNPKSTALQLKKNNNPSFQSWKKCRFLISFFDLSSHLKCVQDSRTIFSIKRANPHHHLSAQLPALQEGIGSKTGRTGPVRGSFPCPLLMITKALVHRVTLSSSGKQAARN